MPEANGIKNEGFKRAMARLLSAKRIEIISTGPHSRQTKQLARPKQ
jgi:hypothetical protein